MEQTRQKPSNRDILIIIGAILALLIGGFATYNFVTGDQPHPINEAPKNPGKAEKLIEMERQEKAMKGGATETDAAAPARPTGDDVEPPAKK